MTPEVVVFDLGKVLVDFNYQIVADRLAARAKLPADAIRQLLDHSPLLFRLEKGLITSRQFYREVCAAAEFNGTFEEFSVTFGDIFSEIPEMIAFHSVLRKNGVPSYIFSNTNELAVAHIRRAFPFFGTFTGYICSYQHGAMKPNHKLYEVVEEQTGCRGTAILYLDDREDNVTTGAARGWQTIIHRTPAESLAVAASLGLPTT
jgi:FMN phosphatase YigB (HAD superfamily)